MKGFIVCMAAVFAAAGCSAADIETYIAAKDCVNKVQVVLYEGAAVAAVNCKPMFLQSERRAFIKDTETEVAKKFGLSEVIVTMDVDVYHDASAINAAIRRGENPEKRIKYLFSVARSRRKYLG